MYGPKAIKMQNDSVSYRTGYTKVCFILVCSLILYGFSYNYFNWCIFFPALLLLTPLRDQFTVKMVTVNVLVLIPLLLAMEVFGKPVFICGILYYFEKIFCFLSPSVFVFLFFDQGRMAKYLLLPMIPAAAFLPVWNIFSFIVFLSHPYKAARIATTVILTPVCMIFLLGALFTALWDSDCFTQNKICTEELIKTVHSNGDEVNVYLTNYQGALGSYGVLIRREHKFLPGINLLKDSVSFYKAYGAELVLLDSKKVLYHVLDHKSGVI